MTIRTFEDIALLSPPYAFAKFDDGQIGGSMLLGYRVTLGPDIHWKRLWAARGDD